MRSSTPSALKGRAQPAVKAVPKRAIQDKMISRAKVPNKGR